MFYYMRVWRDYTCFIAGVFGETITADLIEGGPTVSVTNANRADFVARYVDYVLNKSVELQVRPG